MSNKDMARVVLQMEAEVGRLRRDMDQAKKVVEGSTAGMERASRKAAKGMEHNMTNAASKIGGAFKNFGAGLFAGIAAGGVTGVVAAIGPVANGIATIGDEARRAGLSAKAFQEFGYVAKQNRIGVDSLVDGIKELNLRADEFVVTDKGSAADAFNRLGYDAATLKEKLKDPSALFTEIIGKLGELDRAAQIRVADEIFGGTGGEKFVQLIAQGEAGIKATIQEAHNLGNVMSDEVIERAAELDRQFNAVATTVGTALKSAIVGAASQLQRFIDSFRGFQDQQTGSLQTRWSELQTRRGQLGKQSGTTEDKVLGWIGKDAATEMVAIDAEMATLAAELKKRAMLKLRAELLGAQAKAAPYVPPTTGSTGASRSSSKAAIDSEAEAVAKLIDELQEELRLVGASNTEKEIASTLRRAGVDTASAEGRQIAQLVRQIESETDALERNREAQEQRTEARGNVFGMPGDALSDIVDGSVKAEDAVKKLAVQLAWAAAQAALLGTGPLNGLFNGGGGSGGGALDFLFKGFEGFSSGGYTGPGGKNVPAGVVHRGEYVFDKAAVDRIGVSQLEAIRKGSLAMPEAIRAPVMPRIQAASGGGSPIVVNFNPQIDARGASVEAVARLDQQMERMKRELPATVEASVRNARNRGVKI